MQLKVTVVILMTRLSDYMLNCFHAWRLSSGIDLHVVRRPVAVSESPYDFAEQLGGIAFYQREAFDGDGLRAFLGRIKPDLIICFGWADQDYLAAVRSRTAGTVAVMTLDNQWLGTFRQRAGLVWSRLFLTRLFDYVWVPGPRQAHFARLLGFPKSNIRDGYYVANCKHFTSIRETIDGAPARRLVFVGRYVALKGVRELWQGFIAHHARRESSLELWCIGTGPLNARRPEHPKLRHLGFIQPRDFAEILKGGGIFILPSHFEPWGLAVHEFAIAGFPLILSRAVGAADRFLGPDNGILLDAVTPEAISRALEKIESLSNEQLAAMSRASTHRGMALDVSYWCSQADRFLEGSV
ncbi:MAG: glycosyltransferase family 4 protein [Hyphomicrobiales bacterium]